MFASEPTQEDFEKKFPATTANPPYLQRSISAPAIAENVSDAILPTYNYDDVDMQSSMLYQYGNNGPSRMNPRMPNAKKENDEDIDNGSYADLLDDNTSLLSSLIDNKVRTPMDLIQADFPSTPSSVYSKNVLESKLKESNSGSSTTAEDDRSTTEATATLASSGASVSSATSSKDDGATSAVSTSSIEQATKSFQQLYVNTPQDISNPKNPAPAQANQAPMLSQYHSPMNGGGPGNSNNGGNGNMRPSSFFPAGGNGGNGSDSLLGGGSGLMLGGDKGGHNSSRLFPGAHGGNNMYGDHGPSSYNTLLGNSPSAILNNGLNPLATPVLAPSGSNNNLNGGASSGGLNVVPPAGASGHAGSHPQQQPAYYVQQPVYLDQNGQPIYYRPNPGQGQYGGQEYMYPPPPPTGPDGQPVPMGPDGQMANSFMPYSGVPGGVMGQSGMVNPQAYWSPSGDQQNPSAQQQTQMPPGGGGMPMYMGPGAQGMGPGMDGGRRMVYNPATGQYNSIPVGGPMHPQGMNGGRGAGGPMSGYGMMHGQQQHGGGGGMSSLLGGGGRGDDMFHRDDDRLLRNMHGGGDMYGRDGRDGYSRGNDRDRGMGMGGRDRDGRDRDGRNGRGMGGGGMSSLGMNPVRDSLVEEFRSTYGKSRQWGLRDLLGHVVAFCQDQHGSRFIQQRLEVCSDVDKQLIFDEIIPAAQSLMTDVFGNYVLQKLFEYGTPDQCEALALLLKGQSVQLAMQMYGCRVVQKALEYVSTQRLIDLVSEFESPPLLLRCVHDSNGNHVIQKCIEIVSKVAKEASTPEMSEYLSGRIQFIIAAFQGRVKELSSHPYGCRVVQRILEHCSNAQKAVILEELRQCCTDLVQDCYGNYVIQFVMQHGWEADRAVLIREVQANLLDFSQHKFASNVVEKCLQYANKKDRDEMIWTIINVTFDLKNPVDAKGHCVLESMVRDPYANYVVQKVIDVSDERQRAAIMRYVKENITQLRRYTYGKHIIVRLEKITNEKF